MFTVQYYYNLTDKLRNRPSMCERVRASDAITARESAMQRHPLYKEITVKAN